MRDYLEQSLGCLCSASVAPLIRPLFAIVLMGISRLIWVSFRLLKDQSLQKNTKIQENGIQICICHFFLCNVGPPYL